MSDLYNIYCDESCHIKNDGSDIMVLGAMKCPESLRRQVYNDIRDIKKRHGIDSTDEIKWTKISDSKIDMFIELVEYFFAQTELHFRGLVIDGKSKLRHDIYNKNDHNLWYYKMYYLLLDKLCYPSDQYRIFIDVKDTHGGPRIRELHKALCDSKYDYMRDIILDINQVNSERSDITQLADIFIGALSFYHRGFMEDPERSKAKKQVINKIIEHVGNEIHTGTSLSEEKYNLFIWKPREV